MPDGASAVERRSNRPRERLIGLWRRAEARPAFGPTRRLLVERRLEEPANIGYAGGKESAGTAVGVGSGGGDDDTEVGLGEEPARTLPSESAAHTPWVASDRRRS